jgi:hypothetical protein
MSTQLLEVQKYLQTKSFEDLTKEYGIVVTKHDLLPLCILNYHQIESIKTHPISRECRALVLDIRDFSVVGKSFNRFFNWGEVQEEMKQFDFSDFIVEEKLDGSLVLLFHFDGHWHVTTRGSFAQEKLQQDSDLTWKEGILRAMGLKNLDDLNNYRLEKGYTYVCEFVSPWNKVVRQYKEPKLYLLSAFRGNKEMPYDLLDTHHSTSKFSTLFLRPERFRYNSIESIIAFLKDWSESDPTFEGVVIRDRNNLRFKVKSLTYLSLHRMRGSGDSIYLPQNLLPFVLSGEIAELLTYFPETREKVNELQEIVEEQLGKLEQLWLENKNAELQKDFALGIQGKTPFTSILFQVRKKYGKDGSWKDVETEFRNSPELILKWLKKNPIFHPAETSSTS